MIIAYYPGAGGNRYLRQIENLEWQQCDRSYDTQVKDQLFSNRYLSHDSCIKDQEGFILTHCVNTPLIAKNFPGRPITIIMADLQACLRREWVLAGHQRYWMKAQLHQNLNSQLELYNAVRDPSWPDIQHKEQIQLLPLHVQQELVLCQDQITKSQAMSSVSGDALAVLQKNYHDQIESAYATVQWHLMYYGKYPLDLSCCQIVVEINGCDKFAEVMTRELDTYHSEIFDDCWAELA